MTIDSSGRRVSDGRAGTHTNEGREVSHHSGEVGNDYAEFVDFLNSVWHSAPVTVSPMGWVELALKLADRVGEHGRCYKKNIPLSKEAAEIAWKEENSVPGILSFTPDFYLNGSGEPRRGKTKIRTGWEIQKAVKICEKLNIDLNATPALAKAGTTSPPQRTATTTARAQVVATLQHWTTATPPALLDARGLPPSLSDLAWPSPLILPTGIEVVDFSEPSSQSADSQSLTAKLEPPLSSEQVGNRVCEKVNTAPRPPVIVRKALKRQTCERSTVEAIYQYVPEAKEDKVLFRWIVYALWTNWRDLMTFRRVIHHEIVDWIGCYRFGTAAAVLEYVKERLPIDCSGTWAPGSHTRQILKDGLPEELWKEVQMDLDTPPSDYGTRVYVLSGRVVTKNDAHEIRKELREEIKGMEAPSPTAHRIWKRMNGLPARRFSRFQDKIGEALTYVDRMEIDVSVSPLQKWRLRQCTGCEKDDDTGDLSGNVTRYKAAVRDKKRKLAEEQRTEYKQILHRIAHQHKPFYKFSRHERTDRIFSHNDSILLLPSEVREILTEDLYDVDLKSAHLLIAAWLWDAGSALERLTQEGYSIWDDLMAHCEGLFEEQGLEVPAKGTALYDKVKAGMKIMVYSTVYGMPAPSIQAEVTKALQGILGPDVGGHLKVHPVIASILQKRNEVLSGLEPGDTLRAPSGIEIEVEVTLDEEKDDDCNEVGPRSAVATQAQAFEQELMSVLLDVAEERDRTYLLLWLHDGGVCKADHPNALETDVNELLDEKRRELTAFAGKDRLLPAHFEVERIEKPEMPPKDVHGRIAGAGRGALRLKDGETAVRVDEDTGEELGPAGSKTLLKAEHELYRVADTYIRISEDGYVTTSDPFPEDKLWQKLDKDDKETSSTSSEETASSDETIHETNQNPDKDPNSNPNQTSRPETAPGAESPSSEEASSPDSDTSTTSASPASPDAIGEAPSGDSIPAEPEPPEPSSRSTQADTGETSGPVAKAPQTLPIPHQRHLKRSSIPTRHKVV